VRRVQEAQVKPTTASRPRSNSDAADQVADWWTRVLVGQTELAHPVYGDAIDLKLRGGVLHVAGELASDQERHSFIREARSFVGRGLDDVDVKRLVVKRPHGTPGILDQTLIGAFPNQALAEHALKFLREHTRVKLKEAGTVKSGQDKVLDRLGDFADTVRKALADGKGIVIVRVDEPDAFEARELLDEDTRSQWTLALPPVPARRPG
jgi:hypothetical protein